MSVRSLSVCLFVPVVAWIECRLVMSLDGILLVWFVDRFPHESVLTQYFDELPSGFSFECFVFVRFLVSNISVES